MSLATSVLVHGLQFEVATLEEVVKSHGRHVEETVLARAVAVHKVVACSHLQARCHKVAALHITAKVVVVLVDFLTFGKAHIHPVSLTGKVPAVVEQGKLQTHACIVGAFVLTLHIH